MAATTSSVSSSFKSAFASNFCLLLAGMSSRLMRAMRSPALVGGGVGVRGGGGGGGVGWAGGGGGGGCRLRLFVLLAQFVGALRRRFCVGVSLLGDRFGLIGLGGGELLLQRRLRRLRCRLCRFGD